MCQNENEFEVQTRFSFINGKERRDVFEIQHSIICWLKRWREKIGTINRGMQI